MQSRVIPFDFDFKMSTFRGINDIYDTATFHVCLSKGSTNNSPSDSTSLVKVTKGTTPCFPPKRPFDGFQAEWHGSNAGEPQSKPG